MVLETITYERIISDITTQNYVELPLVIPKKSLEEAAKYFLDFLTLPQDLKNSFGIMADGDDRGSESGYAQKKRTSGDSDNKEYFNYRELSEELLKRQLRENSNNQKVQRFFQSARTVFQETVTTLQELIEIIDEHHPGIYHSIFVEDQKRRLCLRFVKYDSAEAGEFLALGHYDRGSCALALAESAPGLRVGRNKDTLKKIIRLKNRGIFMPAYTFNRDTNSELFPPAWHDVVQESNDRYSKEIARWAIILFADVHSDNTISYGDTHTPKRVR